MRQAISMIPEYFKFTCEIGNDTIPLAPFYFGVAQF